MSIVWIVMMVATAGGCDDRDTLFGPASPACVGTVASAGAATGKSAPAAREPAAHESDPDVLVQRAHAALDAHNLDSADKLAQQALRENGATPDAYVVLGDVALAQRRPSDALASYDRALTLDPRDGWALVRAGEALTELGRRVEARARLRAFVADHPDAIPDVFDALGWMEMDASDAARAKAAFARALEVSKERDPDAWYGLAVLAADASDAAGMERALRRVLVLDAARRDEIQHDEAFEPLRQSPQWRGLFAPER